jgi:selenophosphate synthase
MTADRATPGDRLILTKAIGTGEVTTGEAGHIQVEPDRSA